jgi:hypothetical protein
MPPAWRGSLEQLTATGDRAYRKLPAVVPAALFSFEQTAGTIQADIRSAIHGELADHETVDRRRGCRGTGQAPAKLWS